LEIRTHWDVLGYVKHRHWILFYDKTVETSIDLFKVLSVKYSPLSFFFLTVKALHLIRYVFPIAFNPLNAELNPIRHFLALLGAHHILHVSRIRVKLLWNMNGTHVFNTYVTHYSKQIFKFYMIKH
jgi:hypothetical protein